MFFRWQIISLWELSPFGRTFLTLPYIIEEFSTLKFSKVPTLYQWVPYSNHSVRPCTIPILYDKPSLLLPTHLKF